MNARSRQADEFLARLFSVRQEMLGFKSIPRFQAVRATVAESDGHPFSLSVANYGIACYSELGEVTTHELGKCTRINMDNVC